MTVEELERALVELRVPLGALDAALAEVRRDRFVERDAFTRFYVRERLRGVGHAAALASSVEYARRVGIPVVHHPADFAEDVTDIDSGAPAAGTPAVPRSPPEPEVVPTAPTTSPARSWLGVLASFWLVAVLAVVGLVIVRATGPLELPVAPIPGSSCAPTLDIVQRVVVIGRTRSGKSVFLARLLRHFHEEVNHNPAAPWTVEVMRAEDRLSVDETEEILRRSEWPTAAPDFVVATVREREAGKRHILQMSEASLEPAGGAPVDSHSVMLLIDGTRLDAPETWDLDELIERRELGHRHADLPRASWLALIITKIDELASSGGSPEQVARARVPEATLTRLRRCFRWVHVFAVSAVGKTLAGPDGERLPDPHGVPVGLQEPLVWLLEGRKSHGVERQARNVERQHAADDAASQTVWAKHETVRRARAQRRRVGVALVLAALVAAFAVFRKVFG